MILLDTCIMIDIATERPLGDHVHRELAIAAGRRQALISAASAWELGKLASAGRLAISSSPAMMFNAFLQDRGLQLAPLTPEIFIASSFLPGEFHRDPMDRILVATARETGARILTRDRAILAYGAKGHVKTIAC